MDVRSVNKHPRRFLLPHFAPIAQSVEQLPFKEWVPGSSPGGRTKRMRGVLCEPEGDGPRRGRGNFQQKIICDHERKRAPACSFLFGASRSDVLPAGKTARQDRENLRVTTSKLFVITSVRTATPIYPTEYPFARRFCIGKKSGSGNSSHENQSHRSHFSGSITHTSPAAHSAFTKSVI